MTIFATFQNLVISFNNMFVFSEPYFPGDDCYIFLESFLASFWHFEVHFQTDKLSSSSYNLYMGAFSQKYCHEGSSLHLWITFNMSHFFPLGKPFFYVLQNTCLKIRLFRLLQSLWDYPVCKWCRESCVLTDILGGYLAWHVHPEGRPFWTARWPTYKYAMPSYENRQGWLSFLDWVKLYFIVFFRRLDKQLSKYFIITSCFRYKTI